MLSTRLHGSIDYAVSALFAGLATGARLPHPVRRAFGAAAAYHASYALLTDYEAGLRPTLSMRQHLRLDSVGAAGLLAAGVLMRRQPPAARLALLAAGLAECAVIATSAPIARSGPGSPTGLPGRVLGADEVPMSRIVDQPVNTPKPVAPDLFIVDSTLPRPFGIWLPVRMTIIRLPDGGLLLHSPTQLTPGLQRALQELGPVKHLVAPDTVHWMFLPDWQRAYPQATSWAAPGLGARWQVRRSGVRFDHELGGQAPPGWDGIELVVFPGLGFCEVALFHRPTRTLVLTDTVLNLRPDQVPPGVRPVAQALGIVGSRGKPPVYVRALIRLRRAAARDAAQRLLALQPERVLFAHGDWFRQDGTAALRDALRWLLPAG